MTTLINMKILDAPDHSIIQKPWMYDLRSLRCSWDSGDKENQWLEMELSTHKRYVIIRFCGLRDVYIPVDEDTGFVSIRIIDMSAYVPEAPAPIRVQHPKGKGLSFWAHTVKLIKDSASTPSR